MSVLYSPVTVPENFSFRGSFILMEDGEFEFFFVLSSFVCLNLRGYRVSERLDHDRESV